ncbi:hypothetical protein L596_028665 [Steinernema carpocapsae]|uniref:UPAR/Ly6 domain-containing protein n=1 Tax=Steinernema carpocapsae TaxID=34508 RepID=A0A4U5LZ18_STECR|nr:hypothetical protein L596_028665 [Steinernema carpocapsae]
MDSRHSLTLLLILAFVTADALKCYHSQQRFNETAQNLTECTAVQFDLPSVSCYKVHDYNTNMVTRGCQTTNCTADAPCHNTTGNNPQQQCCCYGDGCNSAASLGIPVILLGTLAFWQIFKFF